MPHLPCSFVTVYCCQTNMQKSGNLSKNNSLRLTPQQSLRRLGLCSQVATGQHSSPVVFPEKRGKLKASRHGTVTVTSDDLKKVKREEHRIDIADEQSDLLGYEVFSGKLILDKRETSKSNATQTSTDNVNQDAVDAKLTSKALVWGSHVLCLEMSFRWAFQFVLLIASPIKPPFSFCNWTEYVVYGFAGII